MHYIGARKDTSNKGVYGDRDSFYSGSCTLFVLSPTLHLHPSILTYVYTVAEVQWLWLDTTRTR